MTAMTNVLPELLLALPVWPALVFVLWWTLYRAHPRLAEGLSLGALGLNVTLWALVIIGLPSAGTHLIWVRGGQFLDAPLSLSVDPLSAALGIVIAGLALLGPNILGGHRSTRRCAPASLVAGQHPALADRRAPAPALDRLDGPDTGRLGRIATLALDAQGGGHRLTGRHCFDLLPVAHSGRL